MKGFYWWDPMTCWRRLPGMQELAHHSRAEADQRLLSSWRELLDASGSLRPHSRQPGLPNPASWHTIVCRKTQSAGSCSSAVETHFRFSLSPRTEPGERFYVVACQHRRRS